MRKLLFPVLALILAFGLVASMATPTMAATAGPNNGSTFANDSTVGTKDWSNPSNAQTHDNSYATASINNGEVTHYLKATGFGFSIPAGATINGIQVDVERQESGSSTRVNDNSVRLVKGGTISGDDKSTGAGWPSSDAYITYGGPSDTWGLSWNYSDINSADFGVVISAIHDGSSHSRTAYIDHIRITVYYNLIGLNPNAVGDSAQLSIGGSSPPANNWQACQTSDDDTSYVANNVEGSTKYDLYNLDDHGTASGTINSVTVYIEARRSSSGSSTTAQPVIKTGGTEYRPGAHSLTDSYAVYSDTWATNPAGGDWTWTDIDALQAGVELYTTTSTYGSRWSRCTHVWVVVDYTPSAGNNPRNAPSSPSPADDAAGVSINADLGWTGGDPDGGDTVTYDVYFGDTTPPTSGLR